MTGRGIEAASVAHLADAFVLQTLLIRIGILARMTTCEHP